MEQLGRTFPDGYSATLSYDSSDYIKGELRKIVFRTVLSVIILLLFVFWSAGNYATCSSSW